MISLIVSSYQKHYFEAFSKNVEETIGAPYEIINIWNPGKMGICEAYNLGASKAQYENLVFCHEDILFHTPNWGHVLIEHLKGDNVGTIGIAGSNYVCKAPTGWHLSDDKYNFINIIQRDKNNNCITKHQLPSTHKAFALDGVFLSITREKFLKINFNEEIKGFHAYDLDFSLRSSQKFDNYVINDILIEHFSIGNPDSIWFNNNINVRKRLNIKTYLQKDNRLEENEFIIFFNNYFKFNNFTIKNFIKTLQFIPSLKSKRILELLYKHIRYWHYYKKHIYRKS